MVAPPGRGEVRHERDGRRVAGARFAARRLETRRKCEPDDLIVAVEAGDTLSARARARPAFGAYLVVLHLRLLFRRRVASLLEIRRRHGFWIVSSGTLERRLGTSERRRFSPSRCFFRTRPFPDGVCRSCATSFPRSAPADRGLRAPRSAFLGSACCMPPRRGSNPLLRCGRSRYSRLLYVHGTGAERARLSG